MDHKGDPLLLDKFSDLSHSDQMHSLLAEQIDQMKRVSNVKEIVKAQGILEDCYTSQFLNEQGHITNLTDVQDGINGEIFDGVNYNLLVGPIYQQENWKVLEKEIHTILMCAELAGDFHLGDSRQLTDKSLLPFDLVS
ncbi:hypothetical protein [Acinetobacter haemolyticus]|uniref:hypothetical protein n=1 Tax=Acinetobacter haemolyticus TaxID=29430 RepID=UPI001383B0AC|nr:hypothetical protein [Acinetobacter haemolyticus]NAR71881.1 hypothetical protein [Acinetobacter haemolyticus]